MNIYGKLAAVQHELNGTKLPKTGKNKYGGFQYFELEDILPKITELCYNHGLTFFFTFVEDAGILRIKDWEGSEEITTRVPFPDLWDSNETNKAQKKMNLIQWEGSVITYLKRYLLFNTFLICENEFIDSEICRNEEIDNLKLADCVNNPKTKKDNKKQAAEMKAAETIEPTISNQAEAGEIPAPDIIEEIKSDLKKKNIKTTRKNVAMSLGRLKPSAEVRKSAMEYLKGFDKEAIV